MINKYDETKDLVYENGFYLTSKPYRLGNILAHYEIYKKILSLPGGIIEVGVFKGGSLVQWATFRELLENENSRKIIGFDMFGPFPLSNTIKSDNVFIKKWNKMFAEEFISKEELEKCFIYKGLKNIQLVKGDLRETLPVFLKNNPAFRISLLHIDTDVYEPSKTALEFCWDRVVTGGVVLFDDYTTVEGETVAIDDFFKGKPQQLNKFPFSHEKPSYLIKK